MSRLTPSRHVHRHDALAWLSEHPAPAPASIITSLPDVAEQPEHAFDAWRVWFARAVQAILDWVPAEGVAIFFQTDVLQRGVWVDKSHLVQSAAEASGVMLAWHKIVCRTEPGSSRVGRAGYSHLLCFSRVTRPAFRDALPDVLPDAGDEPSPKAMGVLACEFACRFVLDATPTRLVLDPFCGQGTVLAVANAVGLDAIGVDRSARCCRAARKLSVRSRQRVEPRHDRVEAADELELERGHAHDGIERRE
jgi:hypothetical protein